MGLVKFGQQKLWNKIANVWILSMAKYVFSFILFLLLHSVITECCLYSWFLQFVLQSCQNNYDAALLNCYLYVNFQVAVFNSVSDAFTKVDCCNCLKRIKCMHPFLIVLAKQKEKKLQWNNWSLNTIVENLSELSHCSLEKLGICNNYTIL